MDSQRVRIVAPERIELAGDVAFFTPPPGVREVQIDLRDLEWISPIGIVGLLALHYRAHELGLAAISTIPPRNDRVRDYLHQTGFVSELEMLGAEVGAESRSPDDASPIQPCLRATLVRNEFEMETAANSLSEILRAQHAPINAVHAVYLLMTELTNNAREHGSPCYVMAQTRTGETSGTPGLDLAIADFGPGFLATLSQLGVASEVEAILKAFEEGVTGTGQPYRGFGLTTVMEEVDNYVGATLSIVSHNGWVERRGREFVARQGPQCGGVFVTAYFPFSA